MPRGCCTASGRRSARLAVPSTPTRSWAGSKRPGQAEGKIDAGKLRQWVADVDRDKLKGVLEEAQHLGAGAVSLIGAQGEKLADRAPGAFDKLAGAAKEKLGTLTGDEGLIGEGQIERFKGQIKETIASVSEMADSRSKDAAEAVKTKVDETGRNEPSSA